MNRGMMIQFSKMFKSTMYGNEYVALSVLHYVNSTIIDPASCCIKHVITAQVINSQKTARNSIRIYTVNGKKRIKNDLSVCKEDGNRYIPSWDHSGERFAVKNG